MKSKYQNNKDNQPGLDDLITLSEAAKLSGFTTRHLRHLAENEQLWDLALDLAIAVQVPNHKNPTNGS